MSKLNLNPQILKELLSSLSTPDESDDYELLNYFQVCQLPDHYQMFDEPDELQSKLGFNEFKHPNKRKWAQIIDKNNISTIYICYTDDSLDRIRYPVGVEVESHIVLKGKNRQKQLKLFKHLISKERADDIKAKRDEEHIMALKDFESQIDTDDLKRHIKKWTKNYFIEAGFYNKNDKVLNIDALAESAYFSILTQIFSWYYVTQEKSWEDILDSDEPDIKIGLKFNLFYDYYPVFNKFAEVANEMGNNKLSLKSRLTEHEKISIKYNWYLVRYAKLRCPKMNIKLTYF